MTQNNSAFLDPSILIGIKNLTLRARTVVEGALVGEHISPFRGGSVEFAQHRAYSPGDELKYVDWRLFARTDHYHVKQFEVTTNLRAYLLLDGSGSMAYPEDSNKVSKYHYASILAGALSYVLVQQSDAVSVATTQDGEVEYLPPRSQIAYLHQILGKLEDNQPSGEPGITPLIQYALDRVHQRSLIVLFSDFFVELPELMAKIKVLKSRGHDVMAFQVLDPDEVAFPFNRFYRFESLENNDYTVADGENIRQAYLTALNEHQTNLEDSMRQAGIDFTKVQTDQAPDRVLSNHLNSPIRAKKLRRMY